MWQIQQSDFFAARFKRFQKHHRNEAESALNNLDTYFELLQKGIKPVNIRAGFIHHEGGLKALDQSGGKGRQAQTRLYIYPDEKTEILHVISISLKGGKKQQNIDIQECRHYIESL